MKFVSLILILFSYSLLNAQNCAECPAGATEITGTDNINGGGEFCVTGTWSGSAQNANNGALITICPTATWTLNGSTNLQQNVTIDNYGTITDNGNDYKLTILGQTTLNNQASGSISVGSFEDNEADFINYGTLTAEDLYLHGLVENYGTLISTADCSGNASTNCGFFIGNKSLPLINEGSIFMIDGQIQDGIAGGTGTVTSTGTLVISNNGAATDNNFIVNNLTLQNTSGVSQGSFTISGTFNCNNINFTAEACFDGGTQGSSCANGSTTIDPCMPMPVDFVDFTYKWINDELRLFWEVRSEINTSHYEIIQFSQEEETRIIKTHQAKNVAFYETSIDYQFNDRIVLGLKSVDYDGFEEIFEKKLIINPRFLEVTISPNPTSISQGITFSSKEKGNYYLSIYNLEGKKVKSIVVQNKNQEHIDLSELASGGIYTIEIIGERSSSRQKIILKE